MFQRKLESASTLGLSVCLSTSTEMGGERGRYQPLVRDLHTCLVRVLSLFIILLFCHVALYRHTRLYQVDHTMLCTVFILRLIWHINGVFIFILLRECFPKSNKYVFNAISMNFYERMQFICNVKGRCVHIHMHSYSLNYEFKCSNYI